VADFWVENWDAAKALAQMENTLTAQQNKIDAVIASNDGTALGELTALKAQNLAGKVPISGQDATADGCNSIVKGEQTVTVYKDFRLLAPKSVDTLDALIKGEAIEGVQTIPLKTLFGDDKLTGDMACVFLPVVQVNKDNVYDEIVVSGFQPYDAVYRDIPADQLPPKPGEAAAATEAPAASEPILIGLSFSDFATERWKPESELLTTALEELGYKVVVQEAAHDVKLQNDQIDNMVAQGAKGLIIIAEDGDAVVTSVDKAVAAGVKVIAYDRLIKTANVSAYLTFDNTEVGRQEALGVMTALGLPDSTTLSLIHI
jgi:ABC-type xylose transport system substrate-binding protein